MMGEYMVFFFAWEKIINIIELMLYGAFLDDKLTSRRDLPGLCKLVFIFLILIAPKPHKITSSPKTDGFIAAFTIYSLFAITFYCGSTVKKLFFSFLFLASCFCADLITILIPQFLFHLPIDFRYVIAPVRFLVTLLYASAHGVFVYLSHFARGKTLKLSKKLRLLYITLCLFAFLFSEYLTSLTIFSSTSENSSVITSHLFAASTSCILFFLFSDSAYDRIYI